MSGASPAVTVVVTGANRQHSDSSLALTVSSALGQSLRSIEVIVVGAEVSGLPADRRLRRLDPDRLGGRGAARDAGLEHAAGEYVLFVDSGNELDRHAGRAAVDAAQGTGADVVAGRWERVTRPRTAPRAELFRHTAHYGSLAERPELLYDDVISNKLFSLAFLRRVGLRFGDAHSCADLRFAAEAYALASGITLIPQRLFVQRVEPGLPDPAELLDAHRAIDRLLAEHAIVAGTDGADLAAEKDLRFLNVDLVRYLRGVPPGETADAQELLQALGDYLSSIQPEVLARIDKMLQIAVFMAHKADVAGARTVVDQMERDGKLTTRLVQRDDRVYWVDRYLDTAEGRRVLDVTASGFHELPFSRLQFESRVDAVEIRGNSLQVRGHTLNQLGRVAANPPPKLTLVVSPGGTARRSEVPVTLLEQTPERLTWDAVIDLLSIVHPTWRGFRTWSIRLSLAADGDSNVAPLSAYDDPTLVRRRLLRRRRWYPAGNVLQTQVTAKGNLALRLVPEGRFAVLVARLYRLVLLVSVARKVRHRVAGVRGMVRRLSGSADTKARIYRNVLVRLPLQRRTVVFESHMGQSLSDNPRYVFEELHRRNAGFRIVWSFAGKPPALPPGVRTVRRNSWAYFLELARAGYWVDNQGFPAVLAKPTRTTYLQTWHGSALKRMGEDTPGFRRMSADRQERHRAMVRRWDYFVARSEHDVRTLVPALKVRGEVLRTGYPRNDPLVQLRSPEQRAAVRAELGLPADAVLVLYAPTFRETYASGRQDFVLPIDLDQLAEKLPGHVLLVRTHYLQRLRLPATAHTAARDVSHLPDITPLLVAADMLVTDYSSVMFDFANTGRPMVFYTYDYDNYANSERGVYWELAEQAPGPLVSTSDELIQALSTVERWRPDFDDRYRRFISEFGEYDTGTAAQQVVDHVFFGAARGE